MDPSVGASMGGDGAGCSVSKSKQPHLGLGLLVQELGIYSRRFTRTPMSKSDPKQLSGSGA